VDDDPVCVGVVEYHLQTAGYVTDSAFSGAAAWKILQQHPNDYGVIIMDRIMLGMDGLALLKKIKEDDRVRHIPVIMQTTHAQPDEFVDAVSSGVFDFIYKPVDRTLLLFMIHNAVEHAKAEEAAKAAA